MWNSFKINLIYAFCLCLSCWWLSFCTVWGTHVVFLPLFKASLLALSKNTHSVCPQTFTISFNDGFLYLVVLHLGHPWSSISVGATQNNKLEENVNNSQLPCHFPGGEPRRYTECGPTRNRAKNSSSYVMMGGLHSSSGHTVVYAHSEVPEEVVKVKKQSSLFVYVLFTEDV